MKALLFIKIFLLLPLILFADYILMAIIGCTTCILGFGEDFFCGTYCIAGKIIIASSVLFFGYLIYPEIKGLIKSIINGKVPKKQASL